MHQLQRKSRLKRKGAPPFLLARATALKPGTSRPRPASQAPPALHAVGCDHERRHGAAGSAVVVVAQVGDVGYVEESAPTRAVGQNGWSTNVVPSGRPLP